MAQPVTISGAIVGADHTRLTEGLGRVDRAGQPAADGPQTRRGMGKPRDTSTRALLTGPAANRLTAQHGQVERNSPGQREPQQTTSLAILRPHRAG